MNLVQYQNIDLNNTKLNIVAPQNDDTVKGTFAAISENSFRFSDVEFKPNDVFVDLGCNVGLLSCYVAKKFPFIQVYCFDASPISVHCTKLNSIINELTNITIFQKAIGDKNEKSVKFYSNEKEISALIEESLVRDGRNLDFYTCDKIKIDEIFDSSLLGINDVKYLKVDIEGGEFEVFSHLFKNRPDILDRIEYLHLEVHDYKEYSPEQLKNNIKEKFGKKTLI